MTDPWGDIASPSKDASARRVDHTHPLDLFWAKDHLGRYLFVYEFPTTDSTPKIDPPTLTGIQIALLPAQNADNKSRLILILKEKANWEIFLTLCNDLIFATRKLDSSSTAIQTLLRRLNRWQDFLKKMRSTLLSEESIKGLMGELIFIKNHLMPAFGICQAIKFWQGPEGFPQDFNVNNSAIEVKSQSGATVPVIQISSADQLCPQFADMYLYVVTLGKATPEDKDVMNLPVLIDEIRKALEPEASVYVERFNDLVYMTGYIDSDQYLDFCYVFAAERMFKVGDGFPRICPNDLHPGIVRISYHINLSACESYRQQPDWMDITS